MLGRLDERPDVTGERFLNLLNFVGPDAILFLFARLDVGHNDERHPVLHVIGDGRLTDELHHDAAFGKRGCFGNQVPVDVAAAPGSQGFFALEARQSDGFFLIRRCRRPELEAERTRRG